MTTTAALSPPAATLARRASWRGVAFAGAAVVDALLAPVLALAPRHRPSAAALVAAGLAGRAAYPIAVARIRRRRAERRHRHRLRDLGPADLEGAVEVAGLERLSASRAAGRGTLLVSTHGGPADVVPAALRLHGIELLDVRLTPPPRWTPPLAHRLVEPDAPPDRRTALLVEARDVLRAGGVVRMPLEGFGVPASQPGTSAGAAALARLGRLPAFPVVGSATPRGRVRVTIGEAIPPSASRADDPAFLAALDAAFERLLADDPIARLERATMAARLVAAARPERA